MDWPWTSRSENAFQWDLIGKAGNTYVKFLRNCEENTTLFKEVLFTLFMTADLEGGIRGSDCAPCSEFALIDYLPQILLLIVIALALLLAVKKTRRISAGDS